MPGKGCLMGLSGSSSGLSSWETSMPVVTLLQIDLRELQGTTLD